MFSKFPTWLKRANSQLFSCGATNWRNNRGVAVRPLLRTHVNVSSHSCPVSIRWAHACLLAVGSVSAAELPLGRCVGWRKQISYTYILMTESALMRILVISRGYRLILFWESTADLDFCIWCNELLRNNKWRNYITTFLFVKPLKNVDL